MRGLPGDREFMEAPQAEIIVRNGKRYVVKSFQVARGVLKWVSLGLVYKASYPFALTPDARMKRELDFMGDEHDRVRTPRIVDVDYSRKIVVREYIEGSPLRPWAYEADAARLGEILAWIHAEGWVMGDTKPTNFLEAPGGQIYVVDAEQSLRTEDPRLRGWDLLVAITFTSLAQLLDHFPERIGDASDFRLFVALVLDSYIDAGGGIGAVENMFNYRHMSLYLLLPAHYLSALRKLVKSRIKK